MIFVKKIRKLLYNILDYYDDKSNKKDYYYYVYESNKYISEFDCMSNEKRIGILSKLTQPDIIVCIKILEMLYERNYDFLLDIYKNQNIIDIVIDDFSKSLDDIKLWIKSIQRYFKFNNMKIKKYKTIPTPCKNYKAKTEQKYYEIKEIKEVYYRN